MRRIGSLAGNNSTCVLSMGGYWLLCLVVMYLIALTKASRPRGDMPISHYPIGLHPPCFHRNYVANANRMFAADLYEKVRAASGSDSIILSPFSLSVALAMTFDGADGSTKAQMADTLHFNVPSSCSVNRGFSQLLTVFSYTHFSHSINVLNKRYIEGKFSVLSSYRKLTSDYYHARPVQLPFSKFPDDCRDYINRWAVMETNDTIFSLMPPDTIRSDTVIVLANALTFSGNWLHDFHPPSTTNEPFYTHDSSHVRVPMMRMPCIPKFRYAYVERVRAHVIELPYYNSPIAMYIVLPEIGASLEHIEDGFLWDDTESLGLTSQYVEVSIPRFSLTKDKELAPLLRELGITELFVENVADLSGIAGSDNELWLLNIFHKTYINVNETGTGASAATFNSLCEMPSSQESHVKFIADRPFPFYIWDRMTKSILYNGRFTGRT